MRDFFVSNNYLEMLLASELLQKNFKNPIWPPFKGHNFFSHERNSVDFSQDTQDMF